MTRQLLEHSAKLLAQAHHVATAAGRHEFAEEIWSHLTLLYRHLYGHLVFDTRRAATVCGTCLGEGSAEAHDQGVGCPACGAIRSEDNP